MKHAGPEQRQEPARTLHELAQVAARPRILLICDDAGMRAHVSRLLANSYEVTSTASHSSVLSAARVNTPDLILVDVLLFPDGAKLLRSLRADGQLNTVPIILLSAHADEEPWTEGAEAGADDFLIKPFSAPELMARIGVHLQLTRIRREAEQDRENARETAELLNRIGAAITKELDPHKLTQMITDIATELTGAQFGSFFHNVVDDNGESYRLYTLSGVPAEAFSKFPQPRNTSVFGPTFRGEATVRSDDITKDPRYGNNPPYHGMPDGHLPVRSYLATPVMSRFGNVLGGLFFGHEKVGVFTEQHERIVKGIANQAAIALDNATLFAASRRNEEELKRAIIGLRRANADLEQFAYSASHDLQEPIRNIAIYGEILTRRYGELLDEGGKEYLEFITAGARRMEMLVRDLLTYAHSTQVEDGATKEGDAEEALQKALSNLSAAISSTGAKIISSKLPIVQVHEIQLQQLFQNLIGNAIKYRRGDVAPEIQVTAEPDGAADWRFSIRDNGIGIAPEYSERVFGIFKRLHSREEYSGTGIGLAICQKIAEQNGGRIWVESEGLGKGSTFHFTAPVAPNR